VEIEESSITDEAESDLLVPQGQKYTVIPDLIIDPSASARYLYNSRLIFPENEGFEEFADAFRPIVEFFYLIFPMTILSSILE
jgi:hypothetical protein